jgi:SAM-dependent methyltransferase
MPTYLEKMEELARAQGGYFFPWRSEIGKGDGESAYTDRVEALLRPDSVVLEAGCGHGPDIHVFAPKVAHYIAYDYAPAFVGIAEQNVRRHALSNVQLFVMDSSPKQNAGRATLPAPDQSVDLIISRRGPTNFILAARRVVRPGGRLIQLNPMNSQAPPWNEALPPPLRISVDVEPIEARINTLLGEVSLDFENTEYFDVPEYFADAQQLWLMLTWLKSDPPSFADVQHDIRRVFERWGNSQGVELRHRRFLWTALVE